MRTERMVEELQSLFQEMEAIVAEEQSIRRNPWESIAVTAAVAFALGVILSRRD